MGYAVSLSIVQLIFSERRTLICVFVVNLSVKSHSLPNFMRLITYVFPHFSPVLKIAPSRGLRLL